MHGNTYLDFCFVSIRESEREPQPQQRGKRVQEEEDETYTTMGNAVSTTMTSFKRAFDILFGNRDMRVVMLGLDAAGKTTILYKLHIGGSPLDGPDAWI